MIDIKSFRDLSLEELDIIQKNLITKEEREEMFDRSIRNLEGKKINESSGDK